MSSTNTTNAPSTFEEILAQDGELFFTNEGGSMLPLIHAHLDVLHIVKPDKELDRSDVILYTDKPHHYVLHRILKITKNGEIICAGDNNHWKDRPITRGMVLGRLLDVTYPNGKVIRLDSDYQKEGERCVRHFYWKAFKLRLKRLFRK